MSAADRRSEIAASLEACRARTLALLSHVPEEFLKRRVHSFYSPIGWHFGHIARTEEHWIAVEALRQEPLDANLSFVFADLPENPKDNRVNMPDREAIIDYLARTRSRTIQELDTADLDQDSELLGEGYAWDFAMQHECQHQETIIEMLQLIQKEIGHREPQNDPPDWSVPEPTRSVAIPGGEFTMGSDRRNIYDNEHDAHSVKVDRFDLDETLATAGQWTEFMLEDGYTRKELWSPEGWTWRAENGIERPEYWFLWQGSWATYGPAGPRWVHPNEPVASLSRFEAEAYARWRRKRLPTEAEWEFAAASGSANQTFPWGDQAPTEGHADFGIHNFAPEPVGSHPAGASRHGVLDLAGGTWEWTSSPFLPYPGFRAFPYEGYSKAHMDGRHFVCRGGSWATAAPILRRSFRNWYVPTYRQGLLGVRCAQ